MAATSAPTVPPAAAEQPSFLQSWFGYWLQPCCNSDTKTEDLVVGAAQAPAEDVAWPPIAEGADALDPLNPYQMAPASKEGVLEADRSAAAAKEGVLESERGAAATKEDVAKFKIDNSSLKSSKKPGVAYRSYKSHQEKLRRVAKFGEIVEGVDEGDDWLRVGEFYLPMKFNGIQVVTLLRGDETFSPSKGMPPSPARAKESSPIASSPVDNVVAVLAADAATTQLEDPVQEESSVDAASHGATDDVPFASYFQANFSEPLALGGFQGFYAKFRTVDADVEGVALSYDALSPQKDQAKPCTDPIGVPEIVSDAIKVDEVGQGEEEIALVSKPRVGTDAEGKLARVEQTPAQNRRVWHHRPSVGTWVHSLPYDSEVDI